MAFEPDLMPAGGYGAALIPQGAQTPTATGAPAGNVPGQQAAGTKGSESIWRQFLDKVQTDPNARMALLQAGAVMLAPRRVGETEMGRIAKGAWAGMAAYNAAQVSQQKQALELTKEARAQGTADAKQRLEEAKLENLISYRDRQLAVDRDRLKVWEKSLKGKGTGGSVITAKQLLTAESTAWSIAKKMFPDPPEPDTTFVKADEVDGVVEAYKEQLEEVQRKRAAFVDEKLATLTAGVTATPASEQASSTPAPIAPASPAAAEETPTKPAPAKAPGNSARDLLLRSSATMEDFVKKSLEGISAASGRELTGQEALEFRAYAENYWAQQHKAKGEDTVPVAKNSSSQQLQTEYFALRKVYRANPKDVSSERIQDFLARLRPAVAENPKNMTLVRILKWAEDVQKTLGE